ncbi:MAG: hypothetical protein K0B05_08030 [Bacteroidales bacterium]|nr:hypothetical protein [Bacteroidales bacterium]
MKLIEKIKRILGLPKNKEWLGDLVSELEKKQKANLTLPCFVTNIKETGLIVKVSGLYAYMSFNHAFWRYHLVDSWKVIFHKIIDQKFYCQVYQIKKNPISIVVNGNLPQFTEPELIVGKQYPGIVIAKKKFGIFIEIGYYFDWKHGSLVGLLFKQFFGPDYSFCDCQVGDEIETTFIKKNDSGQLLFSNNQKLSDWYFDKPQKLVGQIVNVRIKKLPNREQPEYLVMDKYQALLNLRNRDYPTKYRKKLRQIIGNLPDGAIINCEVTGYNDNFQTLDLIWIAELDVEFGFENSIQNNINPEIIQKIKSLIRN